MKKLKRVLLSATVAIMLVSCFGDKKTAIGQDFDTDDFENKNFTGNKFNFKDLPEDMCAYLNTDIILSQYAGEGATQVKFDNKRRFMGKYCNFGVILNNIPSNYSLGFLSIVENQGEEETNWKEALEFQKKMKKSTSYVSGLGKAAIWYEKQRKLDIKMDGYTIALTVPALYNKDQPNKEYDYKTIAITIAKSSTLL